MYSYINNFSGLNTASPPSRWVGTGRLRVQHFGGSHSFASFPMGRDWPLARPALRRLAQLRLLSPIG